MSNTLYLPLKAKWYEMIENGVKTEEYREIKAYWVQRLCVWSDGRKIGKSDAEFLASNISYLISAIEEALNASYGKSETECNTRVEFNRENGEIKVYAQKEVVEFVENDTAELSLAEAREIEKSNDTVLRTPHMKEGNVGCKLDLISKPE